MTLLRKFQLPDSYIYQKLKLFNYSGPGSQKSVTIVLNNIKDIAKSKKKKSLVAVNYFKGNLYDLDFVNIPLNLELCGLYFPPSSKKITISSNVGIPDQGYDIVPGFSTRSKELPPILWRTSSAVSPVQSGDRVIIPINLHATQRWMLPQKYASWKNLHFYESVGEGPQTLFVVLLCLLG